MTKSYDQQEMLFHILFLKLFGEYSEKYRDEIFGEHSIFYSIKTAVEKESDITFDMLLKAVVPKTTAKGFEKHSIPEAVINDFMINCLCHLKIFKKGVPIIDPTLLNENTIPFENIIGLLKQRGEEFDQKYAQLFYHISTEYKMPNILFDEKKLEQIKESGDNLPKNISKNEQVRINIFSQLLIDHMTFIGASISGNKLAEESMEILTRESDVTVKDKTLIHKYSKRIKALFKVLDKSVVY